MTGLITNNTHYTFRVGELPAKLAENLRPEQTGYWRYKFDRISEHQPTFCWYCGVANGRILYSGSSLWSPANLLRLIQRYNVHLRKEQFQQRLAQLKDLVKLQAISPIELANQLKQEGMITDQQLKQSLYTKILSDCDQYFTFSDGQAEFVEDRELPNTIQTDGFDLQSILAQADIRRAQWDKLKVYIPSLDSIPALNATPSSLMGEEFSAAQRVKLASMLQSGGNINKIATNLAKDSIDVARMFAKLVQGGIVIMKSPRANTIPQIMVVDDSPLILKQFQHWLTSLEYPVLTCEDATNAVDMIRENHPDAIFIDINMPVISGFELVKRIRLVPEIANIPIVILTGEQKLSNKWRAQWGGCEFMTKPITADEQRDFVNTLQQVIPRLLTSGVIIENN